MSDYIPMNNGFGSDTVGAFAGALFGSWFGGIIQPMPNTLEKPVKIMMIGFAPIQVTPMQIGVNQLRNMHVYKTDPKNMAHAFATAFFSEDDGAGIVESVEISPFPKQKKEEVKQNDN